LARPRTENPVRDESYDVARALVATGYGVALVSRIASHTGPGIAHRPVQHRAAHRTIHTLRRTFEATELTLAFDQPQQATAAEPS
jgi:hypothetical protein